MKKHLIVTNSTSEIEEIKNKLIEKAKEEGKEYSYSDTAVQVEDDIYFLKAFTISFPVGELEGFDDVNVDSILDRLYGLGEEIEKAAGILDADPSTDTAVKKEEAAQANQNKALGAIANLKKDNGKDKEEGSGADKESGTGEPAETKV
jgi:hypothetical protein